MPGKRAAPQNLEQTLDALGRASPEDEEHVTVGRLVESIGRRSFGPLLLLAGLIALAITAGTAAFAIVGLLP